MISKWLAIAFLAAVITGPASAQTTSATSHKEGEWRGSKLAVRWPLSFCGSHPSARAC